MQGYQYTSQMNISTQHNEVSCILLLFLEFTTLYNYLIKETKSATMNIFLFFFYFLFKSIVKVDFSLFSQ